jgi:hypothetical protein
MKREAAALPGARGNKPDTTHLYIAIVAIVRACAWCLALELRRERKEGAGRHVID